MKFINAYYVTYTFNDYPFFIGPYDILECAEKAYNQNLGEPDIQIIKVQKIK